MRVLIFPYNFGLKHYASFYLYCCTEHFEDSLNITYQQMH